MMWHGKREFEHKDILCISFFKNIILSCSYIFAIIYIIFLTKLEKNFGVVAGQPNVMKYWLLFEVVVFFSWCFSISVFLAV